MSTKNVAILLGAVAVVVTAWIGFALKAGKEEPPPPPVVERTREQLDLRDDQLFEKDASEPFAGVLVEFYPGREHKVAIEIVDGKPHGLSRGWFANGQLEVEEYFLQGVAHGPRTRWFENGKKRSEAQIENGQLAGTFMQWHDNGRKAAEATMVDGKPDGVSRGWHPSGAPKSRVELRGGEVVNREYWDDTSN